MSNLSKERVQYLPRLRDEMQRIAQLILAKFAGRLEPYSEAKLLGMLRPDAPNEGYLIVKPTLGGHSIELSVTISRFLNKNERVIDVDDDCTYELCDGAQVEVNWPAYGAMAPDVAMAVLTFWTEVATFANTLKVQMNHRIAHQVETPEQRAINEAKIEKNRIEGVVRRGALSVHSGMRVNARRSVTFSDTDKWSGMVPHGHYDVDIDGKTFRVDVALNEALVTRTK